MERKFYTNDFEQLLKERADEFRMYPSKRVWHSIYNDLHPSRKWPSIGVTLVLITALFLTGYWNANFSNSNTKADDKTIMAASTPSNENVIATDKGKQPTIISDNSYTPTQHPLPYDVTNNYNGSNGANFNTTVNETNIIRLQPGATNTSNNNKGKGQRNRRNSVREVNEIAGTANEVNPTDVTNSSTSSTAVVDKKEVAIFINENKVVAITPAAETAINTTTEENEGNSTTVTTTIIANEEKAAITSTKDNNASNTTTAAPKITMQDKVWIDDYAFYNKKQRGKWKGRISTEIYFTPGITYRKLGSNTNSDYNPALNNSFVAQSTVAADLREAVTHRPGLSFEIGTGIVYAFAKNLRLKAGVQANYTNYIVKANAINHPVTTTLMLNDVNTGYPYMEARASTLANSSGYNNTFVHNQTFQVAIPIGVAVKLFGNDNFDWFVGGTIQPTYIINGKANLLSADHKNYVNDPALIRNWNVNAGLETYFQYKMQSYLLQVGPQFRYQLGSTWAKKYTIKENLYTAGIKIGLLKNF
jgi:hypothetical protein